VEEFWDGGKRKEGKKERRREGNKERRKEWEG